jgi:hypothetical protein
MIGRFLWWLLVRLHGAGANVTEEMLDAIDVVMVLEMDLARRGGPRP